MQISKTARFNEEFLIIYDFMAKDSVARADIFRDELELHLQDLQNFPYKYRQSTKSLDKNSRDLIFKGYVIPYQIYHEKIIILGIFNQNRWNLS